MFFSGRHVHELYHSLVEGLLALAFGGCIAYLADTIALAALKAFG